MKRSETRSLYSVRHLTQAACVSLGYLLLSWWLIGFRFEQVFLLVLFNSFFFISRTTRKFITGFSIFFIFWIVFDYMKAFPNYRYQQVHIESLYQAEKHFFGIETNGMRVTPNEYFLTHSRTILDILTGFFYLCWVPVPLAFATFLFFRNRAGFLQFSLNFLLVNLIGFVIYYLYPAAPPWYVQLHGFQFIPATPGNTGGLEKFDLFFGSGIFRSLYSKSSNVFAAMPSLHSAYPLIVLFYGLKYRMRWFNLMFAVIMIGIWFAAVYNSHHYVLDVLAGISCAVFSIGVFQLAIARSALVRGWIGRFAHAIA